MEKRLWMYLALLVPLAWLFIMSQSYFGAATGFQILFTSFDIYYQKQIEPIRANLTLVSFVLLSIFGGLLYMFAKSSDER